MIILLFFAFISGLVTIAAPCIWPLLPIILSSTATGGRRKPLGVTLGIMASFTFFTLSISYIVKFFPFDPNVLRLFAVIVIGFLGITLIIPALSARLEGWVSRFSGKFGRNNSQSSGFSGGFVTGFSLGIVWSPCAGPILATIATLAATRAVNAQIILVTVAYVLGVGIPLFILSSFGSYLFKRSRMLSAYTGRIQQAFGVIMIITALAIFTNYDKIIQAKLLDAIPSYSTFLYNLEGSDVIQEQLDTLRGAKKDMMKTMPNDRLGNYGPAPEFSGISRWLNSPPLTMSGLKGKVVLIDFWTYTCINCIRTLPHVTAWHKKYSDKGLVIVGVHTPEFEFEKKTQNVQDAITQYDITYPVAQDNNFATWRAYNNRYWPAKYLIDANGILRKYHFGEGDYEEMERAIQALLEESGQQVTDDTLTIEDKTPTERFTPETYLGIQRMERFVSVEAAEEGHHTYTIKKPIPIHNFAYEGPWNIEDERSIAEKGSRLEFSIYAGNVFLVMTPQSGSEKVKVMLDGVAVKDEYAGRDVKDAYVQFDTPRLYHLIDLHGEPGSHRLLLEFESGQVSVFAFTFG